MARKGRKRKWRGQKLPHADDPVVEREPDDRIRASRQPHRRGLPEEDRLSEKAESPLGRLSLKSIITEEQYEAGLRYAVVVGQYRAIICAPRTISGSGRGIACSGDEFCGEIDNVPCLCRERRVRYDVAHAALLDAGQRAAKAVGRIAVWREEIEWSAIDDLRAGLINLAKHFGLTGRANKNSIRSTQCATAPGRLGRFLFQGRRHVTSLAPLS